jgi:hypothetical protein
LVAIAARDTGRIASFARQFQQAFVIGLFKTLRIGAAAVSQLQPSALPGQDAVVAALLFQRAVELAHGQVARGEIGVGVIADCLLNRRLRQRTVKGLGVGWQRPQNQQSRSGSTAHYSQPLRLK